MIMTYNEWQQLWLENYVKPSAKARTYQTYRKMLSCHITPAIGNYALEELTPMRLQTFVTALLKNGNLQTGAGLSVSTVNLIVTIVQNSLKTAYDLGKVAVYSGAKVKRPKVKQKMVSCFTLSEQKRIERAVLADSRKKMLGVLLCLYTGLRVGELLALTWSDIDLQKSLLTVNKTCRDEKRFSASQIVDEPKTESSKRTIPIPKQLIPILKSMKISQKGELLISNKGNPIAIRSYQRSFSFLLNKLNIPHRGFHALRHTFATRAIECGMDVKTLSEVLGHKNATVTLNRYAHSLLEHKKEMMNKLGKLFI